MSKIEDCVYYFGKTVVGENSEIIDIDQVREDGVTHVEQGAIKDVDGRASFHTVVIKRPEYTYSGVLYMSSPKSYVCKDDVRREYRVDINCMEYPIDLEAYHEKTKKEILIRLASLIAFDFSITI